MILHDFRKKNGLFTRKWERDQDFYGTQLNHKEIDGKAT